ncbi:MAG: ATP-binding protein, partial [Planctomycetes bacterium]|nr:ATP-binding protein [Planctomycetota bacterium]
MSQLKTLPSLLINKIAAGEVIDRPASVVKELIENALDSGASQIEVTVAEGGKKFIRLTDNGMGLSQADLPLVFLSHTTSKISTEDDLTGIRTFGFRGEALASLGAVSQARLISKLKNQPGQAGLPAGQAGA